MASKTTRSKVAIGIIFICASLYFAACNKPPDPTQKPIAKVYNHQLLESDLYMKLPKYYDPEDSVRIADQIVNNWIRDKAVLNFAEKNLSDAQKDFDRQLADYRNSLIVYAYERELINQKLDTTVSEEELKAYYDGHIENFKLKTFIVKIRFLKLSENAPKQAKLESWFQSNNEKDFDRLYDYCRKYCENYYLEDNTWLFLQDLLKEVPIPEIDWGNFLQKTEYYKFRSNSFQYLVRIYDYKLRDDTAPFVLERQKVKDLILNKRKVDLINKMREDVVNEAYDKKKITVVGRDT